jgi:hypothetical protein
MYATENKFFFYTLCVFVVVLIMFVITTLPIQISQQYTKSASRRGADRCDEPDPAGADTQVATFSHTKSHDQS